MSLSSRVFDWAMDNPDRLMMGAGGGACATLGAALSGPAGAVTGAFFGVAVTAWAIHATPHEPVLGPHQ